MESGGLDLRPGACHTLAAQSAHLDISMGPMRPATWDGRIVRRENLQQHLVRLLPALQGDHDGSDFRGSAHCTARQCQSWRRPHCWQHCWQYCWQQHTRRAAMKARQLVSGVARECQYWWTSQQHAERQCERSSCARAAACNCQAGCGT